MRAIALKMLAFLALALLGTTALAGAGTPHITPELIAESAVAPGGKITLAVLMRPSPGWHGYWINPGDAGQPLMVEWSLPKGASVGALQFPVPGTLLVSGLMNHVYEHDYAVLAELKVPATAAPGSTIQVNGKARWLACTDKICVPEDADLALTVTVGQPAQRDARFDGWRAALPAPLGSAAHFAIAGNTVRVAVPLPAAVKLDDPHLFVATDSVVDYAAPQVFSRTGDTLVVELPRGKFEPVPMRLCLFKKTPEAAAKALAAAKRASAKNKRRTDPRTLAGAGHIALLTSFGRDELTAEKVGALYRVRWQVELAFKRLKSILRMDRLPAKDPQLARAWLYAHLLVALLLEETLAPLGAASP